MKLSMMSYTMTRQHDHFDLQAMLDLTLELEMAGIDFFGCCGVTPQELRRRVDDMGIPAIGYIFSADFKHGEDASQQAALDKSRKELEIAVALGAPMIMLITPGLPGVERAVTRANYIKGITRLIPYAQDAGLTLTIEHFPGAESPFVTADDVLIALREAPGLKLTYDNGNAATGEEPAASFLRTAEYTVHAHFKDWDVADTETDGYRKMLDGRYYKSALIGEGIMDHAACLRAMKQAGYGGCINIEYEGDKYPPVEGVRRAVAYLRSLDKGNETL